MFALAHSYDKNGLNHVLLEACAFEHLSRGTRHASPVITAGDSLHSTKNEWSIPS